MATKAIFEILKEAAALETDELKAAKLQQSNIFPIKTILQGCFNPNIKFLLPEGDPPYSENDPVSVETRLYSLIKKVDLFVEGGRPVATQSKREMLFIEILESVHPEDARILLNMKDKKDPVPGITARVAWLAFPDLFPVEPVVETEAPAKKAATKKPATRKTGVTKKKLASGPKRTA